MIVRKFLSGFLIAALIFWSLLFLVLTIIGVGTFVVPAKVPEWKAQGLKEAPLFWQILMDMADFLKSFWYIVLPVLLVAALFVSFQAVRGKQQVAQE